MLNWMEGSNKMKHTLYILLFLLTLTSCQSQTGNKTSNDNLGGPCEGCEAVYDYGDRYLPAVDTLPGFQENEPKIKITGTVFKLDGKTPAADVILYIYHTNRKGIYETRGGEEGWARRHGIFRGWIKTGADGRYTFYTFRPASYPSGIAAEHIHITVKEPNKKEYYITDYYFEDDPLLTSRVRNNLKPRGGSGIMKPVLQNGIYVIERDIILGLNIPNYE